LLTRKDDIVTAEKLVACHVSHDGHEEEFELEHESDGTKRILDLLPAFVDMESKSSDHVYVIDEIDRCLHTYAARRLVMTFLDGCTNDTRGQLLATTHDIGLLSQSLLRRDEMWLAERNRDEVSEIFAVSDFSEARKDTDLRKSYLTGRMGGLPSIVIR
jgi:AAA15 family ATPase/GTPase